MKRIFAVVLTAGLVGLAAWVAEPVPASNRIAKQEKLVCTVCHDKPGSKLLTDRGKYFEVMGTLTGYDQVIADFGACTTCHERKPGSKKLTLAGQQFAKVTANMEELGKWIAAHHPTSPPSAPPSPEAEPEPPPEPGPRG